MADLLIILITFIIHGYMLAVYFFFYYMGSCMCVLLLINWRPKRRSVLRHSIVYIRVTSFDLYIYCFSVYIVTLRPLVSCCVKRVTRLRHCVAYNVANNALHSRQSQSSSISLTHARTHLRSPLVLIFSFILLLH